MALLVEWPGARKCLETGVYTGYSTHWLALALPVSKAPVTDGVTLVRMFRQVGLVRQQLVKHLGITLVVVQ